MTDEDIIEALRNKKREREVISNARNMAKKYIINENVIEQIFRGIIEQTTYVELRYIRQRMLL